MVYPHADAQWRRGFAGGSFQRRVALAANVTRRCSDVSFRFSAGAVRNTAAAAPMVAPR